tara:strand:+ start:144 stop:365 length:222 start_codon:yes stop_codon:yes gene_type:complete
MKNDKLDITKIDNVEVELAKIVADNLINNLVLPQQLDILKEKCRFEAARIIKDATGDVLKDLDKCRKEIIERD